MKSHGLQSLTPQRSNFTISLTEWSVQLNQVLTKVLMIPSHYSLSNQNNHYCYRFMNSLVYNSSYIATRNVLLNKIVSGDQNLIK